MDKKAKVTTVQRERYDIVYITNERGMFLDSYIPHEGYRLFAVGATYAQNLMPSRYFVIARNAKEARDIFKNAHGEVLSYIKYVEPTTSEYQDFLLNNYLDHPVIVV